MNELLANLFHVWQARRDGGQSKLEVANNRLEKMCAGYYRSE